MNEPDNFLTRWARRKSEAEAPPTVEAPDAAQGAPREIEEVSTAAPQPTATAQPEVEAEPGFDLASLPSIESISESTDIRGFLRSGVPADLTRTALRRAWASDPAIAISSASPKTNGTSTIRTRYRASACCARQMTYRRFLRSHSGEWTMLPRRVLVW